MWVSCKARSRDPKGTNTGGMAAAERRGSAAWQGAGPLGVGCAIEHERPGLLFSTPRGHLKVHKVYAKSIPLISRE